VTEAGLLYSYSLESGMTERKIEKKGKKEKGLDAFVSSLSYFADGGKKGGKFQKRREKKKGRSSISLILTTTPSILLS